MSEEPQIYYLSERDMAQAVEWLLITARRARDSDGKPTLAPVPMSDPEPAMIYRPVDKTKLCEAVLTALHSLTGHPWQVRPDGN